MAQGNPRPMTTVGTINWPHGYNQQVQQQYLPLPVSSRDEYANRVEVERHEHDATLTFYRDGEKTGKRVAVITVPLSLLDKLTDKES